MRLLQRVCLLAVVVLVSSSCDVSNDPDAFAVTFTNDTPTPVTLALCKSARSERCDDPSYRNDIKPGESIPENIAPAVTTEWAVESSTGELLRCVVLYWKHYPGHDMALRLSTTPTWANPCTDSTARATAK